MELTISREANERLLAHTKGRLMRDLGLSPTSAEQVIELLRQDIRDDESERYAGSRGELGR